jgi:hypothetical protein
MANANLPTGFKLVDDQGGASSLQQFEVDSSNAVLISKNDAIKIEADGSVTRLAAGDGILAGYVVEGIIGADGRNKNNLPASTAGTLICVPVANNVFEIQANNSAILDATSIGATLDIAAVVDGDSVTGVSKMEANSSDLGTGLQLRIIGKNPNSNWGEDFVKLRVVFNEYMGNAGTATI